MDLVAHQKIVSQSPNPHDSAGSLDSSKREDLLVWETLQRLGHTAALSSYLSHLETVEHC